MSQVRVADRPGFVSAASGPPRLPGRTALSSHQGCCDNPARRSCTSLDSQRLTRTGVSWRTRQQSTATTVPLNGLQVPRRAALAPRSGVTGDLAVYIHRRRRQESSRGHRSFQLEAPRRIVSLGACLVPSRSGALHDAEDGASLCPRPAYAGKGVVSTLLY